MAAFSRAIRLGKKKAHAFSLPPAPTPAPLPSFSSLHSSSKWPKKNILPYEIEIMEKKRWDSLESWSMLLDPGNGESSETNQGEREEWMADLSQLFIGNKFASGSHSRIYRGIYKQRAVAVKMVRIPDQDEETQELLEKQFKSEVAFLRNLCHLNIVQARASKGNMGTYRWMAPEMVMEKPYTRKVDVYSFGIVLWELTTALVPFQGMTPVQAAYAASEKNELPHLSTTCSPVFNNLIKKCWSGNPSRRPEFTYIVSVLDKFDECLKDGRPILVHQELRIKSSLCVLFKVCRMHSFTTTSIPAHAYESTSLLRFVSHGFQNPHLVLMYNWILGIEIGYFRTMANMIISVFPCVAKDLAHGNL